MANIVTNLLLFTAFLINCSNAGKKPNILLIVADDLGWNDVGWEGHDSKMYTPYLKTLAEHVKSVRLNNAYVNQLCTQTRSALMTGRFPFHVGTQKGAFWYLEPSGVPIEYPFMPEKLLEAKYNTYMLGKWHLGFCHKKYTPTGRGFEKFTGFWSGAQTYTTHMVDSTKTGKTVEGYDFHDNDDVRRDNTYSTELFATEASKWLDEHNFNNPFFMYLSYQAPHGPLEVPKAYEDACVEQTAGSLRKTYCGMMYALDVSVKKVVDKLKTFNNGEDYRNTIIIFTTDNGAAPNEGGSNWPLRGYKSTLWEGGTRAVSFVHSPRHIQVGGTRNDMFHVVDYFPTILNLAGVAVDYDTIDGIDQWDMISKDVPVKKRTDFVYNIDTQGQAIRMYNWKLILGNPGDPGDWSGSTSNPGSTETATQKEWLFDINDDPEERRDLSKSTDPVHVQKLADMKAEVIRLKRTKVSAINPPPDDKGDPKGGDFFTGWCPDPAA